MEVMKSAKVHSVVEDGTWKRLEHGISEMTAREVNELCFARGVISAETETVPAPFELLEATHISRDTFNLKYLREQPTYVA